MSTYSLFVNPKLHGHLIDLFKTTGSSGSIHTDLSNFPEKIRSTPSILVYETKDVICGDDQVKAFLNERAPKKQMATRLPRRKQPVKETVTIPPPVSSPPESNVDAQEKATDIPVVEDKRPVETPKELEPLKKPTRKRTSTRKQKAPAIDITTEKPKIDESNDELLL